LTRDTLADRGLSGEIARKGEKAPIQAGQRWHVERTNAWHNGFNRLQRCCERREKVIDAFFDLADAIITVRSHPPGMDHPPLGHTAPTPPMIKTSIRATPLSLLVTRTGTRSRPGASALPRPT
jgi:hypothetical protein